jgi:serine/threonine protein kinase
MSSAATEGLCPRCLFAGLEEAPPREELEAGAEDSFEDPPPPGRPNQFGDHELIEEIGQGGMGMVYRARQLSLNRPAAVKVIKLGMDTRQIVARFEAELQALARMDHPNIAKVFDAGVTEAGRPYFAVELVAGLEITRYCDRHQLSTRPRLELFIQVCQAVQHAHQKGIIHRDLKPSNILVVEADRPGWVGCPKIIDFGIAKAVEGRLTDDTLFTAIEQSAVLLSWLEFEEGYVVETAPAPDGPWTPSDATPFLEAGQTRIAVATTGEQQFFRLRQP